MAAQLQNNIICLAVDRLHAGYLGAYGNTWINTPALDRLAAGSFVFDRAIIDSPRLELLYRSLWQGVHALVPTGAQRRKSLPEQFAQAGWQTVLLADDAAVAEHPLATPFSERVLLKPAAHHRSVAHAVEPTQTAEFIAAAVGQLQQLNPPFFWWLHTAALGSVWDAPVEFREQYRDEDDPPAESWCEVPNKVLPEKFDPDQLLAVSHAYAGQVTLLDQLLASLLASIDDAEIARNTLLVLLSPRGFPLGEHRRVGPCDDALYAELVHVPAMLRYPDGLGAADRSAALVQPADFSATILEWAGLSASEDAPTIAGRGRSLLPLIAGRASAVFDRACVTAPDQKAIVTPAWSLRISKDTAASSAAGESASRTELFAKPDDWFEVNEVSNRAPEVVEQLRRALAEFESACQTGAPATLSKLPGELIHGME